MKLTFTVSRVISHLPLFLERIATTLLLPCIAILVAIDVALRSSGIGTFSWTHELLGLLLLVLFLMTLPHCAQRDDLIKVDLFTRFFSTTINHWVTRLSNVLSAAIGCLLSYHAFVAAKDMYTYNDGMVTLDAPLWPFASIISLLAAVWAIGQLTQIFTGPVKGIDQGSVK